MILGHIKWDGGVQEVALHKMKGEDAFGSRLFGQHRKNVLENVRKRLKDANGYSEAAEDFLEFDDKTLTLAKD